MAKYVNPKMLLDSYDRAPEEGEIMISRTWPKIALKIEIHKVDIERQYATYTIYDFAACPSGEITTANGKYFKHLFQAYSFEDEVCAHDWQPVTLAGARRYNNYKCTKCGEYRGGPK